jgi:hypothetical protein
VGSSPDMGEAQPSSRLVGILGSGAGTNEAAPSVDS